MRSSYDEATVFRWSEYFQAPNICWSRPQAESELQAAPSNAVRFSRWHFKGAGYCLYHIFETTCTDEVMKAPEILTSPSERFLRATQDPEISH